jgi:hypothetical protein
MSNCNQCVKLNTIPGCIDSDEFILENLTFPDFNSMTLTGIFVDVATGRADNFDIDVDGAGLPTIDIAPFYALSDSHPYQIKFISEDGTPANFLLTNPDATTEQGCCIEFGVYPGLIASDTWELSSQTCTA